MSDEVKSISIVIWGRKEKEIKVETNRDPDTQSRRHGDTENEYAFGED